MPAYGQLDPWSEKAVDSAGDEGARRLAGLLELRGQGADQVAMRATYLDLLEIKPGQQVLDVGCGSGVVTRDAARRASPGGHVIGVDPSPTMLEVARELAAKHGLTELIEFQVGDVRALPFEDASFDVVLAITVLSHATDGEHALPELVRVLRPGGRIGILDLDGDSTVLSHPDRDLTRRIIAAATDEMIGDGWLMRRMLPLLADLSIENVGIRAFTPLERDPAGFYGATAVVRAEGAAKAGAISDAELQGWLAELRAQQDAGQFLAGTTNLFAWGTRP